MNNRDLVAALAENNDMTQADARRLIDAIIETFKDNLARGISFSIPELGTFDTHTRKERNSYNPHYGKFMRHPPKQVIDFRPSKSLKEDMKEIEL